MAILWNLQDLLGLNVPSTGNWFLFRCSNEFLMYSHVYEILGYIAVMPATDNINIDHMNSIVLGNLVRIDVDHNPVEIDSVRLLYLQEDASKDNELNHALESLDLLYYGDSVFAQDVSVNGRDTMVPRLQ